MSIFLSPFADPMSYVFDGLWFLLLIHMIYGEACEIRRALKARGTKGLWTYGSFWNVVDVLNIFAGLVVAATTAYRFSLATIVEPYLQDGFEWDEERYDEFHDHVEHMVPLWSSVIVQIK